LVSSALSVFSVLIVAAGIFANAESTGANTVNSPPLSVETRSTFGFSLPDTEATSVFSSGLPEAAVATGAAAIPSIEPAPVALALA
jgi:hypothetical protein